jgi:hypothetical protein
LTSPLARGEEDDEEAHLKLVLELALNAVEAEVGKDDDNGAETVLCSDDVDNEEFVRSLGTSGSPFLGYGLFKLMYKRFIANTSPLK